MTRSSVPDFNLDGVTWQCWITPENTYEWRSSCETFAVWRVGKSFYRRFGNTNIEVRARTLRDAMSDAQERNMRAA
jgi:hypothetical protein